MNLVGRIQFPTDSRDTRNVPNGSFGRMVIVSWDRYDLKNWQGARRSSNGPKPMGHEQSRGVRARKLS